MNTKRGLLWLFAVLSPFSGALGAPKEPVLIKPTERQGLVRREHDPTIVQQRNILVDLVAFRASDNERFRLPLFDGVEIVLIRDGQEKPGEKTWAWYGHVENQPGSFAVLSNYGDALAANVITRNRESRAAFYHIRYLGNGVHALRQLDPRKFPSESSPDEEPDEDGDPCTTDSGSQIDALVVYTDDAQTAAGGKDGIESVIDDARLSTNRSYSNSNVSQRLRVVHTAKVDYTESGDAVKDRRRLRSTKNPIDNVHQLRDTHGADVVVLIVSKLDSCGKSFAMSSVSTSFQSKAFAVVRLDCAADNLSFPHELGHIMGARHEWERKQEENWPIDRDTNGDPILYNHGYILRTPTSPGTPWRTIMATDHDCDHRDCTVRLPYWSNPSVPSPEGGDPMGVASGSEPSDNHLRLNDTAKTVANFRCHTH